MKGAVSVPSGAAGAGVNRDAGTSGRRALSPDGQWGTGTPAPHPRRAFRPFYWALGPTVLATHVATLAAAFSVWAYLDRHLWFFGDEWDFLTRRGLHGATFSLWAPHNEHWSVLPILLWRAIFSIEHLSTYWAYLVPLLLVHVAVVHLVWRRCLREGARPWVATALALLFALFGTGAEDLAWAFQVGFVSSLMFGLLALEVVEGPAALVMREPAGTSPGQSRRWLGRDATAAVLAVCSLMCSAIGVAMLLALGTVLLARRGRRSAVGVLAVPVALYVTWFALAGHKGLAATGDTLHTSVFLRIPLFVATNLMRDLGHGWGWPAAGPAMAVAVFAWLLWRSVDLFRRHPSVLGASAAAVLFYAMAAVGRDRISATMSPSRYAYIGFALLIPALALMLSAVTGVGAVDRLWPGRLAPRQRGPTPRRALVAGLTQAVVLSVVAAATAANVVSGLNFVRSRTVFVRGLEDQILTTAALLQERPQMSRAVDRYPIWASGFASGYLTPGEMATLYRTRVLPRPPALLMSASQVREDESWLDLTAARRPFYPGRFVLVRVTGLAVVAVKGNDRGPGAALGWSAGPPFGWPAGPAACVLAYRPRPASGPEVLRFEASRGAQKAAVWLSLGARGGRVHFALARTWGFRGVAGDGGVAGEIDQPTTGGFLWLNDSVPGDPLVLRLSAGETAEVCGLAGVGQGKPLGTVRA